MQHYPGIGTLLEVAHHPRRVDDRKVFELQNRPHRRMLRQGERRRKIMALAPADRAVALIREPRRIQHHGKRAAVDLKLSRRQHRRHRIYGHAVIFA